MTRTALLLTAAALLLNWSVGRADEKKDEAKPDQAVVPACHSCKTCIAGGCSAGACASCENTCSTCVECSKCKTGCHTCAATESCGCLTGCADCGPKKSCLQKLCGWFFYCPAKTKDCCCKKCSCCCGPLYQFFLCTPIPSAHIGDGRYIGQFPSRGGADYAPAVVLPPPCKCPQCPPQQ